MSQLRFGELIISENQNRVNKNFSKSEINFGKKKTRHNGRANRCYV